MGLADGVVVGKDELANDVRATCEQLRFTRLEILDFETTSANEVASLNLYSFLLSMLYMFRA